VNSEILGRSHGRNVLHFPLISEGRGLMLNQKRFYMKVSIIYEPGCPNYQKAREIVEEVCQTEGLEFSIEMIDSTSRDLDPRWRGFGSPTVLLDGQEVDPSDGQGQCCRVYRNEEGALQGFPSRKAVAELIRRSSSSDSGVEMN